MDFLWLGSFPFSWEDKHRGPVGHLKVTSTAYVLQYTGTGLFSTVQPNLCLWQRCADSELISLSKTRTFGLPYGPSSVGAGQPFKSHQGGGCSKTPVTGSTGLRTSKIALGSLLVSRKHPSNTGTL